MATDFKFPDVGEGIAEGEIVKWHVKEGDQIKEHDILADVETDKAIVEIPSPLSGTILKIHHKQGDTVKVGEVLVSIGEKDEKVSDTKKKPIVKEAGAVGYLEEAQEVSKEKHITANKKPESSTSALPAVRRAARDLGIDIEKVKGTGSEGRVTEEDVRKFGKESGKKIIEDNIEQVHANVQKKYDMYGYIEKVPLKGVRKTIADHMVKSISTIPHVTHMDEVDVTSLYIHREREKRIAESRNIKLTYLPFIMKACVAALRKNPKFNSSMDDEHGEIILKKYFNFGIAVDTSDGLMVPVLKGVNEKSVFKLATEIVDLAEKARDRKLDLADFKGGTFTLTNIGSLGGTFATPIINHPESAILAIGRISDRLVVNKAGRIQIRKILPLSLAFDHRIADGADAARCMNSIKELLQDPDLLLMDDQ